METKEVFEKIEDFFSENRDILLKYIGKRRQWVKIDFNDISLFDPSLGSYLLDEPEECLKAFEKVIQEVNGAPEGMKPRIFNLPTTQIRNIWEVRGEDVGKFIKLKGTINKASGILHVCESATFECSACGNVHKVKQTNNKLKKPKKCGCGCKKFFELNKTMVDTIKLGIMDDLMDSDNKSRSITREKICIMGGDLTKREIDQEIKPGRKVILNGYFTYKQKSETTEFESIFEVNSIEFVEVGWETVDIFPSEEKEIKKLSKDKNIISKLANSIADVKGFDHIKTACLLLLAGAPNIYDDNDILASRGTIHLLLCGDPGAAKCFKKGTKVLMFNGVVKNIEDIKKGDVVMGDDSTPRVVETTSKGKEQMYDIFPMKGDKYTVNESHILSLKGTKKGKMYYNEKIDIPLKEYVKLNDTRKSLLKGYRVPVDFSEQEVPIDPYFLGLWLGDGNSHNQTITNPDKEVHTFLNNYAKQLNLRVSQYKDKRNSNSDAYCIVSNTPGNPLKNKLNSLNLINNKHIPQNYLINSRDNRLKLLAGLLDSDGNLTHNTFAITQKRKELMEQILFLARSLGFAAYMSETQVNGKTYYQSHISGDINLIPVKIERKKAKPRKQIKNVLHTGIKVVPVGEGEYFGFTVKGKNKRFLLADFTVVHNTYIAKRAGSISPVNSFQSAANASGKGLVASVAQDKEMGSWVVYPGIVPMSHKGVAVIDEIDKTHPDDYGDHNNAMNDMCYTGDTEILTSKGWKRFDSLEGNEIVATLNEKKEIEYHKVLNYIKKQHDGQLINIENQQVNLKVTPEHNLYVSIRKWGPEWKDYDLIPAENVYEKHMRFKKDGIWKGNFVEFFEIPSIIKKLNQNSEIKLKPIKVKMNDFLEFMGWFISEGCVVKTNGVPYRTVISQINQDNIKEIKKCINNLGFNYKSNGKNIVINNKQLASFLNKYSCGAKNKQVPSFIKNLCSDQIEIFVKSMTKGDGWNTNISFGYCSSSKRLVDDMQELLLKTGRSGNVKKRIFGDSKILGRTIKKENKQLYYSIIAKTKSKPYVNHHGLQTRKERYKGLVYCVTVPNHVIYVRRKGIPVWCGNCVPVAKANVKARLDTQTSYLATANPENRVFTTFEMIYNQIDMPKDFLDRFDVIFPMISPSDSKERDVIMDTMLNRHLKNEEKKAAENICWMPDFEHEFIRKYIAYCRQKNPTPKINKKLFGSIKTKLHELMKPSGDEQVKVSFRQLESILRFAYASARLKLRDVTEEDINLSFDLKKKSFMDLGIINERGEFSWAKLEDVHIEDINDKQKIKKTLRDVMPNAGDEAVVQDIIEICKDKGISEDIVEEYLGKLKKRGDYFEPKPGMFKKL